MLLLPSFVPRWRFWPALLAGAVLSLPVSPAAAQLAVTTQNGDNARTGADTVETVLSPAALRGGKVGKLFTITGLEANVNGQVLYVPAVTINGSVHNALYAYTSNNSDNSPCGLWAFDADTGGTLWHTPLPGSATYTTATPVIDTGADIMYVLTKTGTDVTGSTYLHAIDITSGREEPGSPVQVQASVSGTGDGAVNGVVSFDGASTGNNRFHANDRPGLLLLNGTVYAAFAHNTDSFPYHGWVLGYRYSGTGFTQTAVFCTTPNGSDGGIWMSGKGLTVGPEGNIYCAVGNGTFDANSKGITSGTDYGMCFLKLSPSLQVLDWFSPHDEGSQSQADLDTSNTGLVALPGTSRLFGGATKFGSGFLLESSSLGGFTAGGPDKVVQRLDGISGNSEVGQNPVVWDAGNVKYVYLWPKGSNIEQFTYDTATAAFNPAGIAKQTASLTNGGSLAVSADGSDGGGVLWAVGSNGVVYALDATDVSQTELWDSSLNSSRDALGSVGHFQFPTVTNSKVYVPTGASSIAVYGILTPGWTGRSASVGPDNAARVLWDRSDGVAAVWKLDTSGNLTTQQQYGPYAGWTAKSVAVAPDNSVRLLWTNANGLATFWSLNAVNQMTGQQQYGPYAGWTPKNVAAAPDGTGRVLWTNADGTASVWTLSAANQMTGQQQYGPYAGWAAKSLAISPDGTEHMLWTKSDGTASFWRLNSGSQLLDQHQYGPYAGYTATSIAAAPDGTSRVAWNATDGHIALWTIDASNAYSGQNQYGPYSGWAFQSLSIGTDDNARLLWDNITGQAALWSLTPGGGFASNYQFGPY
jgi:hypothetical protein